MSYSLCQYLGVGQKFDLSGAGQVFKSILVGTTSQLVNLPGLWTDEAGDDSGSSGTS